MIRLRRSSACALVLLALAACDDTGRSGADVALFGRASGPTSFVDGAFTVTVTRAEVAFGPAYFCATTGSSTELCESAVLETLDVHVIDATDAASQPLGSLVGVTGDVRTVQYDLGIAFLLANTAPTPLPDAIGGHSVVLGGTATDGIVTVDFLAEVDVTAKVSGNTAIVGARTTAAIPARGATLTLAVDASRWLTGLDWAAIASAPHAPGEVVTIPTGSTDHDAILRGITTNAPIAFEWTTP